MRNEALHVCARVFFIDIQYTYSGDCKCRSCSSVHSGVCFIHRALMCCVKRKKGSRERRELFWQLSLGGFTERNKKLKYPVF